MYKYKKAMLIIPEDISDFQQIGQYLTFQNS